MASLPATASSTNISVFRRLFALPRETRDTFFLLLVIAWTVLPHLLQLPLWCAALTVSVLAWRARLAWVGGALPNRWVLAGVLMLVAGLTLFSFRTVLGKEPGVALIVSLMALKTLELRARRDAFVVFFLGFFLILTHFVFSQSLLVAAAMVISVWGLLTALVLAHMPVGQPALRQAAGLAGRTALLGAPIMVLLFLLFPRFGPLWGVPQDGLASTGLSNQMRFGSVAEMALSDSIAMRLRFFDAIPTPAQQYFRGPVLSRFDGQEWLPMLSSSLGERGRLDANLRIQGPALRYEMTLEPLKLRIVPLLEATAEAPQLDGPAQNLTMRNDLQWLAEQRVYERLRFTATAHPRFQHGPTSSHLGLQDHLMLPAGYNPRTLAWAAELRRQMPTASANQLAQALYTHIRTAGFSYTLAPGAYGETDPRQSIDEFWLDRKAGFCEHFAASFVVIMRALDVPARVVTGFQGMDPIPVDGYYIVRHSSAHAWAEYWQEGVGWVRADPTAAIAPDRIERNLRLTPAPGLVGGAINAVNPALLRQLRDAWEGLNNRWNQWVLNYSRGQQLDLLKKLGVQSPSWEDLGLLLVGLLSSLALVGAGWAWWDRHRVNPWVRQWLRLREALAPLKLNLEEHTPPLGVAAQLRLAAVRANAAQQNILQQMAQLLERLDGQRYGVDTLAHPDHTLTRRFVALAKELRAASARATG
ncbi:MAG: transglutaminaseTgpA domain-containing protein [Burkholderiales bacterium]